jgi:hypothetical protein
VARWWGRQGREQDAQGRHRRDGSPYSARSAEPAGVALHVEVGPAGPRRFRRRGRRYVVIAVLGHWWESEPWWLAGHASRMEPPGECEVWRVEARAEGSTETGVHDLRHDGHAWRLIRTVD